VFVNIRKRKDVEEIEYFVVPSKEVAAKMYMSETWCQLNVKHAEKFRTRWSIFGSPTK
jgi:hypothetical protein